MRSMPSPGLGLTLCGSALLALSLVVSAAGAPAARRKVEFNRDIRFILSDNCFYCHGPDQNHRKAGLRLDVRADALAAKAIVPGKPEESELVRRLFATDPDEVMPPPEAHKVLTPAQKELLRQWVAEGAEYQAHWAYLPPERPAPPTVKNASWGRTPVDAFILRELEARKWKPSPEADRRTLLRRLSLDLTGLPPTPAEVAAFLADKDPEAYERQVERLLASPHYGERMAVPWLDAVRFADTVGYHGDQNQNIFPYRDYVIAAFNRNQPFDQFTREQLAGDLLPKPSTEQLIASGFNRLNMMTREGGAQPREYLAKYAADRVRTIGTAWLGATLACAECHDHKFDPFTTRDFYSLAAYFADLRQWGVYSDYRYTPNPDLKGWSNEHPFPPEVEVENAYLKARARQLQQRLDELVVTTAAGRSTNAAAGQAFDQWLVAAAEFLRANPDGWAAPPAEVQVEAKAAPEKGGGGGAGKKAAASAPVWQAATNAVVQADGSILSTAAAAQKERLRLRPAPGTIAALRLELLPHARHGGKILRGGANTALLQMTLTHQPRAGRPLKLGVFHADADLKDPRFDNGAAVLGVKSGWKVAGQLLGSRQTAVWVLETPVTVNEGDQLLVEFKDASPLGCYRVGVSPFADQKAPFSGLGAELRQALAVPPAERSPAQRLLLERVHFLGGATPLEPRREYQRLHQDWLECRDGLTPTLVAVATTPAVTRILPRGNWQDESGPVVSPATPHFLPRLKPAPERETRLDLARWLTAPENPLTARAVMNRLWKQFFGAGLSGQVEDLGAQGEWPSHPELLDWLAVEFRERGWDIRHMVRLLVNSATYRQSANLRRELLDLDPQNRLLASQSPRRLDAEFVRDNALAIAGLLVPDVGGPSVRPYQPAGYYESLQFPDRDYRAHTDDRQHRRGIYMHWQRTFLHPMLANFDAPSREDCTANRVVSNTPQQALTLLNDPSFVEAARALAQRVVAVSSDDTRRLAHAYQRALAREPKPKEAASLLKLLAQQREYYRGHSDEAGRLLRVGVSPAPAVAGGDAAELAAWTSVCRVVLNLHETITRY